MLDPKTMKAINCFMRGSTRGDAMRKAGYSPEYVKQHSNFWNRKEVKDEISRRRKEVAKKANLDAGYIVKALQAIVEVDIAALVDKDGKLKSLQDIRPELRQALSVKFDKYGMPEVTQADRLKALDQLAKVLGVYEENVNVNADKAIIDALMAGRRRIGKE